MHHVIIKHGFYAYSKHFWVLSQGLCDLCCNILLVWRPVSLKGKNWTKRMNHLCYADWSQI